MNPDIEEFLSKLKAEFMWLGSIVEQCRPELEAPKLVIHPTNKLEYEALMKRRAVITQLAGQVFGPDICRIEIAEPR